LFTSLFSALWYFDKFNIKPRVVDVYGESFYDLGIMYGSKVRDLALGIGEVAKYLETVLPNILKVSVEEYVNGFLLNTPSYIKEMMYGFANATGLSLKYIILLNSFADIVELASESFGCSQFTCINNTLYGLGPIYARTLDYMPHYILENWQIILRITPPSWSGMNKVLGVTIAGWMGLLSGMNDHGLAMGISQIFSKELDFGTPMGIIILDTLFNTTNVIDAQQHIVNGSKSNIRHAGAWCYMMVDKNENACIVEVTHLHNNTIWHSTTNKPFLVITNHFISPEMIPYHYVPNIAINTYYRKQVLEEILLNKDNFDLKDVIETLRSHYDIKIHGDPGPGYINCICNEWFSGTMHAFAAIVAHNYSLICLTNPKRGPFYLVSFTELIGPIS